MKSFNFLKTLSIGIISLGWSFSLLAGITVFPNQLDQTDKKKNLITAKEFLESETPAVSFINQAKRCGDTAAHLTFDLGDFKRNFESMIDSKEHKDLLAEGFGVWSIDVSSNYKNEHATLIASVIYKKASTPGEAAVDSVRKNYTLYDGKAEYKGLR